LYDGIQFINDDYIGVCNGCKIGGCGNASECACSLINGTWGAYDYSGNQIKSVEYNSEEIEEILRNQ
jgi:hypothetical protein